MNLFSHLAAEPTHEEIYPGAVLMRGLAVDQDAEFFRAVEHILAAAPLHHATTPSGLPMSVMVSDCGTPEAFRRRWDPQEARGRRTWPPIPRVLVDFSLRCAVRAGFPQFRPDACHINRYQAGTKLGLHQDRDEEDAWAPIVSVSLGLPAVFLWGGKKRSDPVRRLGLEHGDVAVWGGPARFVYHGVSPLKAGEHPLTGETRINLTFRKVFKA